MYSFVHSKIQNRLEVENVEALVYIYTNSRLLRQRPGADLIHYYDDNIFLEDSDDNGGASQRRMTMIMMTTLTTWQWRQRP
jgi:hypothetical protein